MKRWTRLYGRRLLHLWFGSCLAVKCFAGWIELRSEPFRLLTDASPGEARGLLEHLQQVRSVFPELGVAGRKAVPIEVVLLSSSNTFRHLQPSSNVAGFFQPGADRDTIFLSRGSDRSTEVATHEYVHELLSRSTIRLPRWLEEGLAEVYSTMRVHRTGEVEVGLPIRQHLGTLRRRALLPAEVLLKVDAHSRTYQDSEQVHLFYAQSWALVHMMLFDPAMRERTPRFLLALQQAEDPEQAFRTQFGLTLSDALTRLPAYLGRQGLPSATVAAGRNPSAQTVEVRLMPTQEAEVRQALWLLAAGRLAEAEQAIQQCRRQWPDSPEVLAGQGTMALHHGEWQAAADHFRQAIAHGSRSAADRFELAALLHQQGRPGSEVMQLLREAIRLNPAHAEARLLLARYLSDSGHPAEAADQLRAGVQVMPRYTALWLELAYIEKVLGRSSESHRAARVVLQTSTQAHEVDAATALLGAAEKRAAPPHGRPSTRSVTPAERKLIEVRGLLESVDCLGEEARLRIRGDSGRVWLKLDRAAHSTGLEGLSLACGGRSGIKVRLRYEPREDEETQTVGEVRELERLP